jgi:hypothetical protein
LRFDKRTLDFIDSDADGRIRTEEVLSAVSFMEKKGVIKEELFSPAAGIDEKLAANMARQSELDKEEPSEMEKAALNNWIDEGKKSDIAILGENTSSAEASLAAVESIIDVFFSTPDDMPLVTDEPDKELPLSSHINPKYAEDIEKFSNLCVKPILGEKSSITRFDWKKIKAAFQQYRTWVQSKPEFSATTKAALIEEEKFLRYRKYLGEFISNYVTMDRLYCSKNPAMFQMGILRIDGKEMNLCFHVDSEASHSALSGRSKCCVLYLKLTRPCDGAVRSICAVVTAGTIGGLYVGRNGVFYDYDGKDWDAVITKVVEAQVSLLEAFWSPWRKLGEAIASTVKKFLSDKQMSADQKLSSDVKKAVDKPAETASAATLASSVAAIGIGVGFLTAAAASLMAAISNMTAWQMGLSIISLILVVSLPSTLLAYLNLRKRDLAAVLNAGGWAVNRPMSFSMKMAADFTKCAKPKGLMTLFLIFAIIIGVFASGAYWYSSKNCDKNQNDMIECDYQSQEKYQAFIKGNAEAGCLLACTMLQSTVTDIR